MKITKRQLKRIIREFTEEEEAMLSNAAALSSPSSAPSKADKALASQKQAQADRAAGQRVASKAKERAKTAATAAGKKMVTSTSGRSKLANMIEGGMEMPEDLINWLIDGICGSAAESETSAARKICRYSAMAVSYGSGVGISTWMMKKAAPYIGDFLRNMSDEEAAAAFDFAKEMYDATMDNLPVDIAIFSAAVSDWKMKNFEKNKIKSESTLNISLEKNVDILKSVSNHNSLRPKIVVGFAAETENLIDNSKKKLNEKNCDWIIANNVSDPSIGFDSDENEITIFDKSNKMEKIKKNSKSVIAEEIVKRVLKNIN